MTCGLSSNDADCVKWGNDSLDIEGDIPYHDNDGGFIVFIIYILIAVPLGVILCCIGGFKVLFLCRERQYQNDEI